MPSPEQPPLSSENLEPGDDLENFDNLEAPTETAPAPEQPEPIDYEKALQSAEDLINHGQIDTLEKQLNPLIEQGVISLYDAQFLLARCITKKIAGLTYLANAITEQQLILEQIFYDSTGSQECYIPGETPPSEDAKKLLAQADLLNKKRTNILDLMIKEQDKQESEHFQNMIEGN